jgi:hypothetical protein
MPRFWFVNEVGTELLQFQLDRFVHNWRKTGEGIEYPRYERIRKKAPRDLHRLDKAWIVPLSGVALR